MKKVVILIVFCCIMFSISGCSVKKTEKLTDAEKFANEYSISEENPFQYVTTDELLELVKSKSGILFLGDSDSEWSSFGVEVLNKVVKEMKIDKVYYFNPNKLKNKEDNDYEQVIDLLQLEEDSSLPIVYVYEKGKIIDQVDYPVHDDSSINDDFKKQLEDEYLDLLSLYL